MNRIKGIILTATLCTLYILSGGYGWAQQAPDDARAPLKENIAVSSDVVLAILPFREVGEDKTLDGTGEVLAELVESRIAIKTKVKMVERRRLRDILSEAHLGLTGAVDGDTAVRVGKLVGATRLAFGSVTRIQGDLLLTFRLVDVETSRIVLAFYERGDSGAKIADLAEKVADNVSLALVVEDH